MEKELKTLIASPIQNCILYIGSELAQTMLIQKNIMGLPFTRELLEKERATILKNNNSTANIDLLLREQKCLEDISKKIIISKYNSINSHSLISLWSAIETVIEDTIILIFLNKKECIKYLEENNYTIKKQKYKISPSIPLNENQAAEIYKSFEHQTKQKIIDKKISMGEEKKANIGEIYCNMMNVFELNLNLEQHEKELLTEINSIRNCILHRGGILDDKAAKDMILKVHKVNKPIFIDNKLYLQYYEGIKKFVLLLHSKINN